MEPIYRPILKQAWRITWRAKYLWFFGLFAALVGSSGLYNINFNVDEASDQGNRLLGWRDFWAGGAGNGGWQNLLANVSNIWFIVLLLLFLVMALFLLWLSITAQGALVYGAGQEGEEKSLTFSQAFAKGQEKFRPLLLLNILMALVAGLIFLLVAAPFLILVFKPEYATTTASLFVVVSLLIMAPVGIILSFVVRYGLIYVVNRGRSARAAMSEAWRLFKKNWLTSAEMALIIWFFYLVVGVVLSLAVRYVILPVALFFLSLLLNTYVGSEALIQALIILSLFFYVVVILWLMAILNVFETSAWVLLFGRLNENEVESKVARWAMATFAPEKQVKLLPKVEVLGPVAKEETKIITRRPAVRRTAKSKVKKEEIMGE